MEKQIELLITRFLQNECSEAETSQLLEWLSESDENRYYFEQAEAIWNGTEIIGNSDGVSSESGWEELSKMIDDKKTGKMFVVKKGNEKLKIFSLLKYAAVILISTGATWFGLRYFNGNPLQEPIGMLSVSVEKGSKSKVELADGSIIWLNSETTIRYPEQFSKTQRDVYVEGEAFFEVAKDKNRPFKVHASDMDIVVLGTSFNVKSYPNEGTVETTLTEGALRIEKKLKSGEKQIVSIKPNQRVTLVKEKGKIMLDNIDTFGEIIDNEALTKKEITDTALFDGARKEKIYIHKSIDTELFTSWKDNKLVFKDESFRSIALKLERWYDVKIIIENTEINRYKFTGTFENETIEQAIMALQLTTNFNYKFDKNTIIIK